MIKLKKVIKEKYSSHSYGTPIHFIQSVNELELDISDIVVPDGLNQKDIKYVNKKIDEIIRYAIRLKKEVKDYKVE